MSAFGVPGCCFFFAQGGTISSRFTHIASFARNCLSFLVTNTCFLWARTSASHCDKSTGRPSNARPGCSQLPDGPSRRLYRAHVSDLLACALGEGLSARVARKTAADGYGGGGGGDNDAGYGEDGGDRNDDRRLQVATLLVGDNCFFSSAWRRLLEPLSSHPPREIDLSFASVLPGTYSSQSTLFSGLAAEPTAAENGAGLASAAAARAGAGSEVRVDGADAAKGISEMLPGSPSDSQFASQPPPLQPTAPTPLPLYELIAAAVLPADAPGLKSLNLTGSTGFLPLSHCRHRCTISGGGGLEGEAGGVMNSAAGRSRQAMEAFLLLLRDGLMSPLCKTTHLLLSGLRSPLYPTEVASAGSACGDCNDEGGGASGSGGGRLFCVLGPQDVESLCEAASACSSLQYLDLSGCDMSGANGAAAAAAAVTCLIRNNDDDDYDGGWRGLSIEEGKKRRAEEIGEGEEGAASGRALRDGGSGGDNALSAVASAFGLRGLSLRACGLGTTGLRAVANTLIASFSCDGGRVGVNENDCHAEAPSAVKATAAREAVILRGRGVAAVEGGECRPSRQWKRPRPRLPRLLDLSDNRLSTPSVGGGWRGRVERVEGSGPVAGSVAAAVAVATDGQEEEAAGLRELAASLSVLEQQGLALVIVGGDQGRQSERCSWCRFSVGFSFSSCDLIEWILVLMLCHDLHDAAPTLCAETITPYVFGGDVRN